MNPLSLKFRRLLKKIQVLMDFVAMGTDF